MSFTIDKKEGYTVIKVDTDKLDTQLAPGLKTQLVGLNEKEGKNIIFDLSGCRYCDSSGLSSILIANRIAKTAGGKLVICGLQPAVKKLISISQLDTILTIVDTKEEAVENIKENA